MTMLPKPVLAPAVALAGFRPTLNTEPFVHCTNRLLVVPLLAVKMGLLGLEATEPKSISSTVAPLNTAAVQVAVMVILKKRGSFSVFGVSMAGGVFHNVGQLIVAMLVVETFSVAYYVPVLLIAGVITGFIIGVVANEMLKRLGSIVLS